MNADLAHNQMTQDTAHTYTVQIRNKNYYIAETITVSFITAMKNQKILHGLDIVIHYFARHVKCLYEKPKQMILRKKKKSTILM